MHIVFLCLLYTMPLYLFSWTFPWNFETAKSKKVDFHCPHHCGEWGHESIRNLEWQFVQCLYEAAKFDNYISCNSYRNFFVWGWRSVEEEERYFKPNLNPKFIDQPKDFSSQWYQEMIGASSGGLVITDECNCESLLSAFEGYCIFWKIKHIDHPDGSHQGKVFKRKRYDDRYYYGLSDDEMERLTAEEIENIQQKYADDPDWNTCLCRDLIQKDKYQFNNRIDFTNACMQLEKDLFEKVQDTSCHNTIHIPAFKQAMNNKFAEFASKMQEVQSLYAAIFEECRRLHHAPAADYECILRQLEKAEYEEALDGLKDLLNKVNLESLESNLASRIYSSKGAAEVETHQFDEAISTLSQAIKLNPKNTDAYFERAIAHFERGEFDLSLQDYFAKGKEVVLTQEREIHEIIDFTNGLVKGAVKGINMASTEFLPSLCNSLYGVGNLLWLTVAHPIETPKMLGRAAIDICQYLNCCDPKELAEILVPEMHALVVNWNKLYPDQRGQQLGYVVGKYGLDILLPVASLKGIKYVKAYNDLRKVEKYCFLNTLAAPKSKEALKQASVNWNKQRQKWFADVKLVQDQQNKHIRGKHNFDSKKSEWTHSNPEGLLKKYAGTGQRVQGIPGDPGYRERVDFGEVIGYYINDEKREKKLTTIGTIHYSKQGAHIVPAQPKK